VQKSCPIRIDGTGEIAFFDAKFFQTWYL